MKQYFDQARDLLVLHRYTMLLLQLRNRCCQARNSLPVIHGAITFPLPALDIRHAEFTIGIDPGIVPDSRVNPMKTKHIITSDGDMKGKRATPIHGELCVLHFNPIEPLCNCTTVKKDRCT